MQHIITVPEEPTFLRAWKTAPTRDEYRQILEYIDTLRSLLVQREEEIRKAEDALDNAGVAKGAFGHSLRYRIGLLIERAEAAENREGMWLVWSHEHKSYWPLDRRGYVPLAHAGRFTFEEALKIVLQGNLGMRNGIPEETMMQLPVVLAAQKEKE